MSSSSSSAKSAFYLMMKRAREAQDPPEVAKRLKTGKGPTVLSGGLPSDIADSKSGEPGHSEGQNSPNRGNFAELMKLTSTFDPTTASRLAEGPRNALYTSPQIQNGLVKTMGDLIIKLIVDEIGERPYCVLGDETRDESGTEQLALCVRYCKPQKVGEPFVVQESFLGFVGLEDSDAEAIAGAMLQRLDTVGIDPSKCTS
ncbi:hypothetical protein Pmar_PMAR027213 [Perkinsus marinus ATCC 50983]|uniref:DUF4371 domain-containing protein n=1 Tax=Perkinsus marinus (strain ATCC 50983 / TXsc) TaxID=423536 RepID=C5LPC4_PERM5|nr:hypothetical protein Pmar_PMAR027213 [Perkinsus marinus ATCC 50983]EER01419.1 hypothetical protein Pmar_PMAR027213 [Perkinsus marinus ATCC 50983]|eukprot:XP_002768701.1 hypothetical protein Pmar_PMAR027213 [Perkinsus marinus ATCC 50983]